MSLLDKLKADRAVTETNIIPELKGKIADAAILRNQLLEATFSFGVRGQLNVEFPRKRNAGIPAESQGALVKRTAQASELLVDLLKLNAEDVVASKGRLVINHPDRDLPYILANLDIPVKWKAFSQTLGSTARPGKGATLVSFVDEKGETVPQPPVPGYSKQEDHRALREPDARAPILSRDRIVTAGKEAGQTHLGRWAKELKARENSQKPQEPWERGR